MLKLPACAALAAVLTIGAAAAGAAPLASPVEAGRYTFDRALVLPTPALSPASPIVAAGGLREGGLSARERAAAGRGVRAGRLAVGPAVTRRRSPATRRSSPASATSPTTTARSTTRCTC